MWEGRSTGCAQVGEYYLFRAAFPSILSGTCAQTPRRQPTFPGRPMGKPELPDRPSRRDRRSAPDWIARAPSRAHPLFAPSLPGCAMPPIMRLSVKLLVVLIRPHFFQYRQKDCASPHMRPPSSLSVMRWSTPTSPLPTRSPNHGSTRFTRVEPCNGRAPWRNHLNLSRRRPRASTGRCGHLRHVASLSVRQYVAGIVRVAVGEAPDARTRAEETNRKPGAS